MHSVQSVVIRDDKAVINSANGELCTWLCVYCVYSGQTSPCDQLKSCHLMQGEVRLILIPKFYRWTRFKRCPWVAHAKTAFRLAAPYARVPDGSVEGPEGSH